MGHQSWVYNINGDQSISIAANPNLCLTCVGAALKLLPKTPMNPLQKWVFGSDGTIHLASDPSTLISVFSLTPYANVFFQTQKVIIWKRIGALTQIWKR